MTNDFSAVAVSFQAIGTLLLALILAQLGRMFAWRYAQRWALAWGAMFVAIASVRIYITLQGHIWQVVYLLAEWTFLVLLYAGCRELVDGVRFPMRAAAYALPAAVAIAVVLAHFSATFNDLFVVQAAFVALGTLLSFVACGRASVARRTAGWQTMRLSLALLTILFAAYVPLYAMLNQGFDLGFLSYSSLADLLGCVFLGFSMIFVTFEEASRELNDAVMALQVARDQLQKKLETDPLTEALSRHAFHAMQRGVAGVVAMIDIDHLKQINDADGHAVGDLVIRATANAVRARIRADDLLFRWGGDEFLVILPASTLDVVRDRLAPLADGVMIELPGSRAPMTFHLSWGGAEFGNERSFDEAMRIADAAMYERRRARIA